MPAFIPWILAAFFGGLRYVVGSLALQVLIGLGIGVVTYTGIDLTFDFLKAQAIAAVGGLPGEMIALLGYMKVGSAINVVTSAMAGKFAMTAVRTASGALAVARFFKR